MSKFPSIQNVLNATKKTVLRFPLETVTLIAGTIFSILLFEQKYDDPNKELLVKAIMASSLCLVLFLSVSLYFITSQKNNFLRYTISLLLGGLTTTFIFSFENEITTVEIQQFIALNIALHLLVSFAAFIPKEYNEEEFWEFNKQLFLRILTAGLYSIVLYSGLALALFAIKELFKADLNDKIFAYLFFVIAGIFNTTFFLSGIPYINKKESLQLSYPNGLKKFTQYILLPLISLYLIILIGYEAKILLTLSLPIGWVSNLVLVFAIFGILSFLLVHPIAKENGNLWIKTFNRWFYFLLIPLLVLLFWAIIYRIQLYGFTYERYYVLLLSLWLTHVVAYFLISKKPAIKFIPISMCIAALLSIWGPQSADTISKNSQLNRFEFYIEKLEKKKLNFEEEKELSSIVDFLYYNYGPEVLLNSQTKEKLQIVLKKEKNPGPVRMLQALGVKHRYSYERKNESYDNFYYSFYENTNNTVENIHGYDMVFTVSNYSDFECQKCIEINKRTYTLKSTKNSYGLDLQINGDKIPLKIYSFINTNPAFDLNQNGDKQITQLIEHPKYDILISYLNLNGSLKNKKKIINSYSLKVMVKVKH